MRLPGRSAALALAILAAGCEFPFGSCERDYVEATFPSTITGPARSTPLLSYRLAETNLDPASFDGVRRVVRGEPDAPPGLAFTVEAYDSPERIVLSMIMANPSDPGDTLHVGGVFHGGGWGGVAPPAGSDAIVDFHIGEEEATSADGSLVVRSRTPLRLGVDITFEGLAESSTRLQGDLELRTFTEGVTCS